MTKWVEVDRDKIINLNVVNYVIKLEKRPCIKFVSEDIDHEKTFATQEDCDDYFEDLKIMLEVIQ